MAYREIYEKQVALLVRVLPFVADEEEFALKGGTAINLTGATTRSRSAGRR